MPLFVFQQFDFVSTLNPLCHLFVSVDSSIKSLVNLYLASASATVSFFFSAFKSFYHVCLYICIYIFILYCFLFLIIRNFNLPSLWAPLCLNPKCIVFLCAPSCLVLNQVMPLFLSYGLFFTLNQFTPNLSLFCLAAVSPAISQCVFLFEILRVFFINSNIYIYIYIFFIFIFKF